MQFWSILFGVFVPSSVDATTIGKVRWSLTASTIKGLTVGVLYESIFVGSWSKMKNVAGKGEKNYDVYVKQIIKQSNFKKAGDSTVRVNTQMSSRNGLRPQSIAPGLCWTNIRKVLLLLLSYFFLLLSHQKSSFQLCISSGNQGHII